jgi:hypothetical protein
MEPGADEMLEWTLPSTEGAPIAEVGVEIRGEGGAYGVLHLDWLDWCGAPDTVLGPPSRGGNAWRRAWVDGADKFGFDRGGSYRLTQNRGIGLAIQGTREWTGYCATTEVEPHLCESAGLAVCCRGMKRYYALLLKRGGGVELVRWFDEPTVLAAADLDWEFDDRLMLSLCIDEGELVGSVNGAEVVRARDDMLPGGAVALICEEGRTRFGPVTVEPV